MTSAIVTSYFDFLMSKYMPICLVQYVYFAATFDQERVRANKIIAN